MPNKRNLFLLPRKTLAGDFEFKKYIGDIYRLNQVSYDEFLQKNLSPSTRKMQGLEKVFRNFFPIIHQKAKIKIEYEGYTIGNPKTTPADCTIRGVNYGGSLKVFLKVTNLVTGEIQKIESCLGEIPLMTEEGTFIINGHEKVFVSQMQKCPGVIFCKEIDTATIKKQAIAKIYPSIGSWVHLKVEKYISISIDKKKKFGITTFLLCFSKKIIEGVYTYGYDIKEILNIFYKPIEIKYKDGYWIMPFNREKYQKYRLEFDVFIKGKQIAKRGEILIDESYAALDVPEIQIPFEHASYLFLAEDIFDAKTGEIFCEIGENVPSGKLQILKDQGKVKIYEINNEYLPYVLNSLQVDRITTKDEALEMWANSIKIGTHYGAIGLCWIFNTRFSDKRYYDFDKIGRKRINQILGINRQESYLVIEDVIACVKELILLSEDRRQEDDIDSLANKRLVGVGSIVENYFRMGLIKFEKNLRDRIYTLDSTMAKTSDVFNLRSCLFLVLDGFYRSAQMHDDNNRLSKVAQLRKVSSAGQGVGKERIASGLRETNESKFGRMCAVQTPEGKKIGIIEHLALYTTVDEDGFIQTPYHNVINGVGSNEVVHLNPFEERNKIISTKRLYIEKKQKNGKVCFEPKDDYLVARNGDYTAFFPKDKVNLINIANNQIFSVSASLIPFAGNNDAYRLLSGANMNTQATPLVKMESPFVGTGMEEVLADKIFSKNSGIVKYVDCTRIVVELDDDEKIVDLYTLIFNKRTNTETCITHRALVDIGDRVEKGDIIADGFSTINGELALGKNLLACYMSHPFCYEDAFVLSERLVARDELTSIHIQSHICTVYETRNGPEKITKDVPRVHSELLKNLDEFGIINIGVQVKGGDILVGKVTPSSGETNLSSEYRLLNIIFGEKASEYTDNSLRIPHGGDGFVTDVKIITRPGIEKTGTTIIQEKLALDKINRETQEKIDVIRNSCINKIKKTLKGEKLTAGFNGQKKGETIEVGDTFFKTFDEGSKIPIAAEKFKEVEKLLKSFKFALDEINGEKKKKVSVLKHGYVLPEGILMYIIVEVSTKKTIESGDKLAGRYGNKGVISAIFSEADMPYLKDGTPVDMILNPCGLLSRMNLGQVLETTIGYGIFEMRKRLKKLLMDFANGDKKNKDKAIERMQDCLKNIIDSQNVAQLGLSNSKIDSLKDDEILELCRHFYEYGIKVQIEQFAKFNRQDMEEFLENFNADITGKVDLFDGKTGEKFEGKVLVGYELIMKLCHLVSKKMHARSIGPYSLVNQQPLGGKARFGGQRCGEMEVWALEAHGAAFNTNELLTTKSDDPKRRSRAFAHLTKVHRYSLIITGNASNKLVGESFKLLMYELRAAGFDLFLIDETGEKMQRSV